MKFMLLLWKYFTIFIPKHSMEDNNASLPFKLHTVSDINKNPIKKD